MPPKGKPAVDQIAADAAAAPPSAEVILGAMAEQLTQHYTEMRDAVARGHDVSPQASRTWSVATARPSPANQTLGASLNGATSAGIAAPDQYGEWMRRFGFSMERELEKIDDKEETATKHRHLKHLKASKAASAPPALQADHPAVPPRPTLFPYAVAKDQSDSIFSMELHETAGDAHVLVHNSNYEAVDHHALVTVGACHPSAVGLKGEDPNANATLDQVIALLVQPYLNTSWRLSAFDAAQYKVRAVARWISAFVRVVPPPLGPPPAAPAGAASTQAAAAGAPAAAAGKKATQVVLATDDKNDKKAPAAPSAPWTPYRVEDDDSDTPDIPTLATDAPAPTRDANHGHATAQAVFATRCGDPHQIATLFAYMLRHPNAKFIFANARAAGAAVSGHNPLEADAKTNLFSSFASHRATVAGPTGVALAQLQKDSKLASTPAETLERVLEGTHACSVDIVRGTLKGTIDPNGKPLGYLAWSWNSVTLPDGRRYLLDVALCAATVSLRFLTAHQHSCHAVQTGELTSGADGGGAPAAGAKAAKPEKGGAAPAAAAAQAAQAHTADSATAALTAAFGAYQPLSGAIQHFTPAEYKAAENARGDVPKDPNAAVEVTYGTRGYLKAPMIFQSTNVLPVAAAVVAANCIANGVPASAAWGAWYNPVDAANSTGPLGLSGLASLLPRSCFDENWFFTDPRQFATMHYPNLMYHLLLAPPGVEPQSPTGDRPSTASTASRSIRPNRVVTKAQWEAYPSLLNGATAMGFTLESHPRRSTYVAKGCPVYMSFVVSDPAAVELSVMVYRGAWTQVMQGQSTPVNLTVPADATSAPQILNACDASVVAAAKQVRSNVPVICVKSATSSQSAGSPPTPAANSSPGGIALIDPTYYALTTEEATGRVVLSLMVPDVGTYSVCVGSRKLNPKTGEPSTPFFKLMTVYQAMFSFVPTNEPLMPAICEPTTVARLIAPCTSKITTGSVYFSVAPTMSRIVSVCVVNTFTAPTPAVVKAAALPPAAQGPPGSADSPTKSAAAAAPTPAALIAAPSPNAQNTPVSDKPKPEKRYSFLSWDATTATFNGTCNIEIGTVEIWLGYRPRAPQGKDAAEGLPSVVPPHLLPNAFMTSTPLLWQGLFDVEPPAAVEDDTKTPRSLPGADQTVSGASVAPTGPVASKAMFDFMQQMFNASKTPQTTQTFTAAALTQAWRSGNPNPTTAPEPTEEVADKPAAAKGAKPKKGDKMAAAPVSTEPKKKPKPLEQFVPFVMEIAAVKRIPSKEAGLLTNNFSAGASVPPTSMEDYVPPPSLLYAAPMTLHERRMAHRVLATHH